VGGQRHAPAALAPGKRPGTHCIGGWVGPMAGLDGCGKSRLIGIRSPSRPVRSESLYRLSHPGPPGRCIIEIKTTVCLSVRKFFRLGACYIGTVYVPEFNIIIMMTMKSTQYVAAPYMCCTGICLWKPCNSNYVLIANYHYVSDR